MKGERLQVLDSMSTLVAVLDAQGAVRFANAALENALGLSRRTLVGVEFATFFAQPALLQMALVSARRQEAAGLRFEASLRGLQHELIPAHVNVRPRMGRATFWLSCGRSSSTRARIARSACASRCRRTRS